MNKKGYKNTALGWIPEDWKVENIGNAFNICNNLRFPISEEIRKTMQGEYPYYGPTRIQDFIDEYRVEGKYALIGEDGDHFLKWKELPMTILIDGKFNVNNHAHLIRGEENLTEWFYYFFNHRELTPFLTRQGAGRYKLTKESLAKMPVLLPPVSEQRRIATILSTWDVAIAKEQQLIEALQTRHRALTQQLLSGKRRLKRFKGEMKEVRLGEVCKISKGKALSSYQIVEGEYPVIAGGKTSPYSHNSFTHEKVITISASGAYAGFASFHLDKIWASDCSVIEAIENISDINYLNFQTQFIQPVLYGLQAGGAQPHVFPKDISRIKIQFHCTLREQMVIGEILNTSEQEIQTHRRRLVALQQQKKGLMQVLLTGKVRVKTTEALGMCPR